MIAPVLAWDKDGNVIHCVEWMVAKDDNGNVIGLIDFEAHEANGGKMRDIADVEGAVGSGTWPEWLGGQVHSFRAEVDPRTKRITALVHKMSGHRRERAAIEDKIASRIGQAAGGPADLRDVVGGPNRPLILSAEGKTVGRSMQSGTPRHLPILGMQPKGRNR